MSLTGVRFGTPIKLYSVTGTLVFDHSYNGVSVDLSHLNKGLYLMSVEGFKAKNHKTIKFLQLKKPLKINGFFINTILKWI